MKSIVFYSWQSDLPNPVNRGFIEKALIDAAKTIHNDDSIEIFPRIERDTVGVPGAPDIGATILQKIEAAHIFVCDVSIITQSSDERPTPNPNVLIELGYALKALGTERIIMVMNSEFGGPELLPFDLRTKRVISYRMALDATDRSVQRRILESTLEKGMRIILEGLQISPPGQVIQPVPESVNAVHSIENSKADQALRARTFMTSLVNKFSERSPDYSSADDNEFDEMMVKALDETIGDTAEFSQVAETIASHNAEAAAEACFKGFETILENYNTPRDFSGSFRRIDFDYWKFLGHELFVTFVGLLMRENRWALITDILNNGLYVDNSKSGRDEYKRYWELSQYIELLSHRNERLKLGRLSLHADALKSRHENSSGRSLSFDEFVDADFFLFLHGQFAQNARGGANWKPWTAIYMRGRTPRFLAEAYTKKRAAQLLAVFGVEDTAEFRRRLPEEIALLKRLYPNSWDHDYLPRFESDKFGVQ